MPHLSPAEAERLAALRGYGILDTPNEPEFDAIVRVAARMFRTPIALISLVDENRQWFKARVGIEASETPLSISFCTHAIKGPEVFVVPDASADPRFSNNPLVTSPPGLRFYAGAPLRAEGDRRIGTICVVDSTPRFDFGDLERFQLGRLAERTIAAFEARRQRNMRAA